MKQALLLSACFVVSALIAGEFDPYFKHERPQDAIPDGPRDQLGGDPTIIYRDRRTGSVLCREMLYPDGTLASRTQLFENELHGIQRKWSAKGILLEESPYENGLGHGHFREWNEKGLLTADYMLQRGTGTRRNYYSNGQLKEEVSYKEGQLNGIARTYYANGQIQSYGEWQDGVAQGAAITWDASGCVYNFVSPAQNGKLHGVTLRLTQTQNGARHLLNVAYWVNDRSALAEDYRRFAVFDASLPRYCEKMDDYLKLVDETVLSLREKIGPQVRVAYDPRLIY